MHPIFIYIFTTQYDSGKSGTNKLKSSLDNVYIFTTQYDRGTSGTNELKSSLDKIFSNEQILIAGKLGLTLMVTNWSESLTAGNEDMVLK